MKLCNHCKTPLKAGQVDFCCTGCSVAYNIIQDLNLEQYYSYYNQFSGKAPPAVEIIDNKLDYLSNIQKKDNILSITLMIDGLHCGACIWVIENLMSKQSSIISARVNLTTKRLYLEWHGQENDIHDYVDLIHKLGYKLIPYDATLHNKKEEDSQKDMLTRLAVAGFGFLQSMMVTIIVWAGHWNLEGNTHTQHIMHIITGLISIPCIAYSISPFLKSAYFAIRSKRTNMDVAVVIAIFLTIIISILEGIKNASYTHFDSTLMLLFFLLIGRYADLKIRNKVGYQAMHLLLSQPQTACIEKEGKLILTHVSKAEIGDIILVAAGEKIPLDGMIIEGSTSLDNSIITGETDPIKCSIGDIVYAGSLNISNPIKVKITKLEKNSLISEMVNLIEIASRQKSKFLNISDKVSLLYTPFVIVSSIATFSYWVITDSTITALMNAASVLLITCPCALVLAVPSAYITASSKLMEYGILLKNPEALEKLTQVTNVFLDKTGTLTYGKPQWLNHTEFNKQELSLIKSITEASKHPLCLSVQRKLFNEEERITLYNREEFPGMGISAQYNGKLIKLGNKEFSNATENSQSDTYMEMWINFDGYTKRLIFQDTLRSGAQRFISDLLKKYKSVTMISGDKKEIVDSIAQASHIPQYHSKLLPKEKYDIILKSTGKSLMIGDGINDSAAMKAAHCSMSPNSGIDITQNIADIIYPGQLQSILFTVNMAHKTHSIVKQNVSLSILYNFTTIPFAISGHVTPAIAAVFMCISSITVILNALRIRF